MSRRPSKFVQDTQIPKGVNGKPDFSAFGEVVELPKAQNKALDFSHYGVPVELDKVSPPFLPEQDGDLVFGEDGRPTGIYVADATPKRTWRDMPLADDMSFGQDDPIVVPAQAAPTRQPVPDEGELEFDGPNPFGERALDIYGQAVGPIESGNRYDIIGGYNMAYQGRYQMGRDALADVGVGFTAADREAFLADPEAQDAAFRAFTLQNHATLSRLSRRYREMPRTEQLGILGYAHNQGAGGALDYLRTGTAGRDGFGTNPEVYISAVRNGLSAGQAQEGDTDAS
jgi:hypothetical protein